MGFFRWVFLGFLGGFFNANPDSSSAPPTGPHLVGANGDVVPVWGRRRQTVTFANHDFEFDFFLAAVATKAGHKDVNSLTVTVDS